MRRERPPADGGRSRVDHTTLIVPCIQGCTARTKWSVVPGGALTTIECVLCAPWGAIAMLSPTSSRPGWPLFSVKWTIELVSEGGAFGFFRCAVASCWQILQLTTCC